MTAKALTTHQASHEAVLALCVHEGIDYPALSGDERCEMARRVRFDAILDLEHEARITKVSEAFAPSNLRDGQKADRSTNAASAQERLFATVSALSPADAAAFGEYRKAL